MGGHSRTAARALELAENLARAEADCARLCDELDASDELAATARTCYQLVQTALLFGGIELAARLGVSESVLPR